ncbi:hypothetical protein [Streptomyces sp. NPDC088196]|uniref:hypothetical protein n=1 Tax=Streptomyces sp. NPDC088196 TaxID=3154868 RepID=UPI00344DDC37
MSTSTLHRYCNGDAVPTGYAPEVTPEERVEAHHRWILADGARQRERKPAAVNVTDEAPCATSREQRPAAQEPEPGPEMTHNPTPEASRLAPPSRDRRRTALFATAAVAVVLAATALVPRPVSGDGGGDRKQAADSVTSTRHGTPSEPPPSPLRVRSKSPPRP